MSDTQASTTATRRRTEREPRTPRHGLLDQEGLGLVPGEEVRFAVVLNGGVSLAVWMGGVVLELDRLTKASRLGSSAYAVLKRLTGCRARADVITGTSAGGINGAALALTQVNRGSDPALLRDLWIDQGRLETLLRQPFRGQPTSLLQGDEYFLPKLNAALELLAEPKDHQDPEDAPIDLTITTTVISGNQAVSVDSMGQRLPQRLHAGRFRWERPAGVSGSGDWFSEERLRRTAHRLALAARSSASFPFAFEPSFVPVDNPDHREPDDPADLTEEVRLRPDMAAHVRGWGTGEPGRDRSRFCADGGALANTPTREALEAIESMPAHGPVRRVMLLVFPHAPVEEQDPPDDRSDPFTLAGSLAGILGALTAQGSRTYVEELERHNLAAAGRRGTRHDVLEQVPDPDRLAHLAQDINDHYRTLRRWRAGRDLAAWRTGMTTTGFRGVGATLPDGWSFDRVRSCAELAQDEWAAQQQAAGREPLPYAPQAPASEAALGAPGWGWGVTAALGVTEAIADLLRRLVWVLEPGTDLDTVRTARRNLFDVAAHLRAARDLTDEVWRSDPVLNALPPDQAYWRLRLACYDHMMIGGTTREQVEAEAEGVTGPGRSTAVMQALAPMLDLADGNRAYAGRVVRMLVDQAVDVLRPTLPVLAARAGSGLGQDSGLACWRRVLAPESEPDPEAQPTPTLLARLLQLEIASTTLGDEVSTGASIPVELVQVSAQTENAFARYTRTGDEKLGGASVNRFGGFLKRSWRVNDWIWGRADGATVLARTMLDPKRIRRTARLSGYLEERAAAGDSAERMATDTVDSVLDAVGWCPEARALRDAAIGELTPVLDLRVAEGAMPAALTALARIFGWALHLEAVPGELPALAQAVAADRVDGANPRSRGELFVEENAALLRRLDAPAAPGARPDTGDHRRALDVFDRSGIGEEPLREEAGSDLIIRTATSAAGVIATVADSDRSGLSAARPVTRALRGVMLLPYWALWGLTSRQGVARALSLLAFALGGTALALALLGALSEGLQPVAAAFGGGALLAAFAYGALRTGSLLHGIVLLTPVIPLVVYAVDGRRGGGQDGGSTLLVVGALALGLLLLGSIPMATGSVWSTLDRLADRQGFVRPDPGERATDRTAWALKLGLRRVLAVIWALLTVLAVVVVAGILVALVSWLLDPDQLALARRHPLRTAGAALLLVLAAAVAAHFCGRWLQVLVLRRREGREPEWEFAPLVDPAAVAATWAVVYGTGFLVVAWVVARPALDPPDPLWQRVAFATAVVFALALLALPVLLPVTAVAAAGRREVARAVSLPLGSTDPRPTRRHVFADDLVVRGVAHRRFVRPQARAAALTGRGERLEQQVYDARAAASLQRTWDAPRRLTARDVEELREVLPEWAEGPGAEISRPAGRALARLGTVLEDPQARPERVRHAVDRLLAALARSSGRT